MAPPGHKPGRGIQLELEVFSELEPDSETQHSGVQDSVKSISCAGGPEPIPRVTDTVEVEGSPVFLVPSELELAVEDVKEVGHQIDSAIVSELDHLLQAEIQLIIGGKSICSKGMDIRGKAVVSWARALKSVVNKSKILLYDPALPGQEVEGDIDIIGELVEA